MVKHKIVIAGAGGIGRATGLLLREMGDFDADIYIGDVDEKVAKDAAKWISEGSSKQGIVEAFAMPKEGTNAAFDAVLSKADIVLDCLPGSQAPRIATLAKKHNTHYANLTEYVKETDEVTKIAEGSGKGFLLQTGLAPGFIDVLANGLFKQFCKQYGVDKVDTITMKVGALTKSSAHPHYYGFTWSPIGVATEYVEPAIVVRNGQKTLRPSLTDRSTIVIDGVAYEEALTSGGAADLPDALNGKVKHLDYKTLRYPGHYAWAEKILHDLPIGPDRSDRLQAKMLEAIPLAEDDVIIIYSSVQGKDKNGNLRIIQKSYSIDPIVINNKHLRAIQTTTAAGLAESARQLLSGKYKGVVLQSQIDPEEFMKGPFVAKIYTESKK